MPNLFTKYQIMFMLNSNEPIKVAHLQKLANQSMLNVALMIETVNNSFSESKKNFGRLIKQGALASKKKKKTRYGQFLLDFAKYLTY